MQAGILRSRIIIEKQSLVDNGFGGMGVTWSTMATVWAKVEHLSGRELQMAQQVSPDVTYETTIRYRSDVTTNHRINYGGKYFNILDVKDLDNMHKWIFLKCEVRESEQ